MNTDLMRFVDRFLGIPLCWILAMLHRLSKRAYPNNLSAEVKDILVIKFFGMGSVILATPSLTLIRRGFPKARITFLSFHQNGEILARISTIDRVVTIDRSSVWRFVASTFRAIHTIRTIGPQVCFDLEFFSKFSTIVSAISRATIRGAFHLPTRWRSGLVTHQIRLDKNRHVIHSFCALVRSVIELEDQDPPLESPSIEQGDHRSLLQKLPIEGRRLISVNINAGDTFPERRWPKEKFAELISRLARQNDALFCFTGNQSDTPRVAVAIANTDCVERCVDASGKLTIPELGALLERSDILISNDSGPLHLAASLGTPVVGLFGPEDPEFYGPTHPEAIVVYRKLECSPCMNIYAAKQFRCPYQARCMREITVDQVFARIQSEVLIEA